PLWKLLTLAECLHTLQRDSSDTGYRDNNGNPILIGSVVRMPVTLNTEVHGEWSDYTVIQKGMIPVLSYLRSEKGQIVPKGYMASLLSDEYDSKLLIFATDSTFLRPINSIIVQDSNETDS
ncbi:MAG: hypothetical protein KDC95_24010, partial [Planctomycetes bacterium]|nr:hypothetical protein [Planctomycetota bacterium]